jgi:hypothetical protein
LSADFTDVAGGVQLTITSSLASGENVDPGNALFLNSNPVKTGDLAFLTFALTANTGFSQAATVATGEDMFMADGDGKYDIMFNYTASTKAFTTGQSQTYLITTFMSAFPSSRRVNSWLHWKHWLQALPGRAGGAVVMTTVDHTLMRGSKPHDR